MVREVAAGAQISQELFPRPWTKAERRAVVRGLAGRMLIAIEALLCFVVFGVLAAGLVFKPLPAPAQLNPHDSATVLAPMFGLAASAFLAYAVALMLAPIRSLRNTFLPIYVVDGYVRFRAPDRRSDPESNGYIGVLGHNRRTIAEWPSRGIGRLSESIRPALIEFSFYGGVHRIDGRSCS